MEQDKEEYEYSVVYPLIGIAILVIGLVSGFIFSQVFDGNLNQSASASQPVHGELRTNLN